MEWCKLFQKGINHNAESLILHDMVVSSILHLSTNIPKISFTSSVVKIDPQKNIHLSIYTKVYSKFVIHLTTAPFLIGLYMLGISSFLARYKFLNDYPLYLAGDELVPS